MPSAPVTLSPKGPENGASSTRADTPAKLRDVAQQFEALLLSQMLKLARESGAAGWLGTGDDQSSSSAMELAEEQFAQALSARGGLGLSKLVVSGLQVRPQGPRATATSAAAATPSPLATRTRAGSGEPPPGSSGQRVE